MELLLNRQDFTEESTIGDLTLDGVHICFVLEDTVREIDGVPVDEWKIFGKTAIPRGRYQITLEQSGKFGPNTMTLNNVRGFSYIRCHSGNRATDSDGCLLAGETKGVDVVNNSRAALEKWKDIVVSAIDGGQSVWITIQ